MKKQILNAEQKRYIAEVMFEFYSPSGVAAFLSRDDESVLLDWFRIVILYGIWKWENHGPMLIDCQIYGDYALFVDVDDQGAPSTDIYAIEDIHDFLTRYMAEEDEDERDDMRSSVSDIASTDQSFALVKCDGVDL
jgi:hypothetical protein